MRRYRVFPRAVMIIAGLCAGEYYPIRASVLSVNVNTTPVRNTVGFLAFDFIGGTPIANNSAVISAFTSDSVLGAGTASGSVLGTLVPGPLTLTDLQFFNEWLQPVTFGSTLSFQLTLAINNSQGSIPDAFSFFLLDRNQVPFATSDSSGANSLIEIDINSSNPTPNVFASSFASATVTPVQSQVPEVSSIWLVFSGVLIGSIGRVIKATRLR